MDFTFRPLTMWPGEPTRLRQSSKFKATHNQTLALLERELKHLRARNVVIQAAVDASQIKRDGMLYADAAPRHPGIILSFESKHGQLSYPCDRYSDWRDNLRAIALSLEALRAVDRYGVTRRAEQYKGWAALPSPNGEMGRHEAAQLLHRLTGAMLPNDPATIEKLLQLAERKARPDAGGDEQTFKRVQEARRVLLGGRA